MYLRKEFLYPKKMMPIIAYFYVELYIEKIQ